MPRTKEPNTKPCEVCGTVIRYKADVPRHQRLHSSQVEEMKYKCPVKGCDYQTLQKSNLKTHMLTHTGEKPHACPDCDFHTADPGSLTRHRKGTHGYVPKEKSLSAKAPVGTKKSGRYRPYNGRKVASTSSPFDSSLDNLLEELSSTSTSTSAQPSCGVSDALCDAVQDKWLSYTWDKDLFPSEVSSDAYISNSAAPIASSPFNISLAVDTCTQLNSGFEFDFNLLELFPVQSQSHQTICSADMFFAEPVVATPAEFSWDFDAGYIQTPAPFVVDADAGACYGSPGHVMSYASPAFHSPSTSIPSSPGSYFSDCSIDSLSPFPSPSPSPFR